jgi:hypothetical protein
MNNMALSPGTGGPQRGDLVWSALPDAPVVAPVRRSFREWLGRRSYDTVRFWNLASPFQALRPTRPEE